MLNLRIRLLQNLSLASLYLEFLHSPQLLDFWGSFNMGAFSCVFVAEGTQHKNRSYRSRNECMCVKGGILSKCDYDYMNMTTYMTSACSTTIPKTCSAPGDNKHPVVLHLSGVLFKIFVNMCT